MCETYKVRSLKLSEYAEVLSACETYKYDEVDVMNGEGERFLVLFIDRPPHMVLVAIYDLTADDNGNVRFALSFLGD